MKRFLLSVIALVAVICSVLSCKKQFSDPEESLDSLRLINQVGNLSIDLNEIVNELPKTALYNAGENAKAYLGKAQWQYTNEGLIVRIPLKLDSATYLYALKSYNNPQEVTVYIAKYKPVQSNYNKFTGTFIWLNLKDGYVYGTKYVNDSAAETLTPIAALNPDFEACAVEHRYFEMSPSTGEIKLKDSLNFLVDPQDCNQPNGRGGNFWNGLKRFFSDFDGVLGDIFGTGGGSAGPKWNPFEPSSPEWGGGGGSGHSSGGGGGGWSGGGGGGSGGGAPLTGGGDPLEFGDGPGMPYTIELPDTSGFLPSRKTALEVYVQSKPYGMLDCNDIESLEGFLPFIQDIASYEPAVAVTNRIDSIIDAIPEYNTFNTYIQNIENGEGVVNLDIFAVLIDSFPKNTDSIRMTPLEFLERFRKSLSPDFTTGGPTSFAPYKHILSGWFTIFDDGSFWRDDEKSLGAWININIPLNSGSVVISDYEIDPINDHYWFTFTTMTTQKDGRHPVCGNRRFGLMPHQDGGWQFYISGADRVWLWHEAMINEYSDGYFGFDKADALWTLIRNNVKAFVNNTGGIASDLPPGSIKVRIQWEGAVKDFLLGNITLEELKTALNCP